MNRQPVTKILPLHIDTQEREEVIKDARLKGYITDQEKNELLFLERLLSEETNVADE